MKLSSRCGFTLSEFLIIASIMIIAITISLQSFVALNKDYKVLIGYLSSYLKGREAIDKISKDCRSAVQVMDSYSGYTTTDDCLVLKVPSIDASGNIIDVNNAFDYIIYRILGQDLWKTVIPGASSSRTAVNAVLKESVESLYMACDGTPLSSVAHKSTVMHLTLWLSIVETVLGKDYRIIPGTTVKLMNYEWEYVR